MVWAPETNDLTVYVKRKLRRCYVRPASLCHSVSRWRSNGGVSHRWNFSGVSHACMSDGIWMMFGTSDGISQGSHMFGCQMNFFVGLTCLDVRWNLDDVWHVWHLLSHSMISIDLAAQAASPATLFSPPFLYSHGLPLLWWELRPKAVGRTAMVCKRSIHERLALDLPCMRSGQTHQSQMGALPL